MFVRTGCITAENPFPPMHGPSGEVCAVNNTDANGGILSWSVTCTTSTITVHEVWSVHYHGETMDGKMTLRTTLPDRAPKQHSNYRAAISVPAPLRKEQRGAVCDVLHLLWTT